MHIYKFRSCNVSIKVSLKIALCSSIGEMLISLTTQGRVKKNNIKHYGTRLVCSNLQPPYLSDLANNRLLTFFDRFKTLWWGKLSKPIEFYSKGIEVLADKLNSGKKLFQITLNI